MTPIDIQTLKAKQDAIRFYGQEVVDAMVQSATWSILTRQKQIWHEARKIYPDSLPCDFHYLATLRKKHLEHIRGVSVQDLTIETYMYRLAATELTIYN